MTLLVPGITYLGVEIAFSIPDWFPPASEEYVVKNKDYSTPYSNRAINELGELPHIHEIATAMTCGNYVTFKFEAVLPSQIRQEIANCEILLAGVIAKYHKSIDGHEYLVQGHTDKDHHFLDNVYEVLDLSDAGNPGEVMILGTHKECEDWING